MEYNVKRWQELAGMTPSESGPLNESKTKRKVLSESSKKRSIVETKIREAIRSEIQKVIEAAIEAGDSDWIYRGAPRGIPSKDKSGNITMGFFGYGFK